MSRFVYFVRPIGQEGPVKIGCSEFPVNRMLALMTWAPVPLEIAFLFPGNFDLERRINCAFAGFPASQIAARLESWNAVLGYVQRLQQNCRLASRGAPGRSSAVRDQVKISKSDLPPVMPNELTPDPRPTFFPDIPIDTCSYTSAPAGRPDPSIAAPDIRRHIAVLAYKS